VLNVEKGFLQWLAVSTPILMD